jgi:hypothetical protein
MLQYTTSDLVCKLAKGCRNLPHSTATDRKIRHPLTSNQKLTKHFIVLCVFTIGVIEKPLPFEKLIILFKLLETSEPVTTPEVHNNYLPFSPQQETKSKLSKILCRNREQKLTKKAVS